MNIVPFNAGPGQSTQAAADPTAAKIAANPVDPAVSVALEFERLANWSLYERDASGDIPEDQVAAIAEKMTECEGRLARTRAQTFAGAAAKLRAALLDEGLDVPAGDDASDDENRELIVSVLLDLERLCRAACMPVVSMRRV